MRYRGPGTFATVAVLAALGTLCAQEPALAKGSSEDDDAWKANEPKEKGEKATAAKGRASKAEADATDDADAKANADAKADAKAEANANVAEQPTATIVHEDAPPPPAAISAEDKTPERAPVYGKRSDWSITPYGYARLDAIEDSTQSFEDGIQPNLIQRAGTYRGDHRRTIMTARDSRLGIFVGAPTYRGMRTSSQLELDFYGLVPSDARRHDTVVFGPLRIRLAYFKLETGIVDIIAGQYYDLFGWNGSFYPATVGYLGVPAEIYHRNPQLRIEKKVHLGELEIDAAVAAVRPGQRDSGLPEGQVGLKISYHGWSGAATPGFGRPALAPLSIGLSGLYRSFEVPVFRSEPGSASLKTFGYGLAANLLVPIIPAKTLKEKGNSLTLTGEYSIGTGIADMYTFMDGGSRFPLLPNPNLSQPASQYAANVDPGLVTFDRNLDLKTINWQAFVGGLQYYLPVDNGRLWIAGIYSRVWSNNIQDLTPAASWGAIFTKMDYFDANLAYDITPAIVMGLSFQRVQQTFADVSPDVPVFGQSNDVNMRVPLSMPGTGGVAAHARNDRVQLSMSFFF